MEIVIKLYNKGIMILIVTRETGFFKKTWFLGSASAAGGAVLLRRCGIEKFGGAIELSGYLKGDRILGRDLERGDRACGPSHPSFPLWRGFSFFLADILPSRPQRDIL